MTNQPFVDPNPHPKIPQKMTLWLPVNPQVLRLTLLEEFPSIQKPHPRQHVLGCNPNYLKFQNS